MQPPGMITSVIGFGLVFAVPTAVGLILWRIHPEWPTWSYPVFGMMFGLPMALVALYAWSRALDKALNERRRRALAVAAAAFVIISIGSAFSASRGKWPFERSVASPVEPLPARPGSGQGELRMSPGERQLHVRAVLGLKEEAAAWMKHLEDSGAHGPAGTIPGFLDVEPLSDRIRVRNRGDSVARVAVSRSWSPPGAPESEICPYRSVRGPAQFEIAAGESVDFIPAPACRAARGDLEFRVGDPALADRLGWWSDSAITRWRALNGGVPVER